MFTQNVGAVVHCYCAKESPYWFLTDFSLGSEDELCYSWKRSTGVAKASMYAIALFIVTFNQIAYFVCLLSVDLVGFHYTS